MLRLGHYIIIFGVISGILIGAGSVFPFMIASLVLFSLTVICLLIGIFLGWNNENTRVLMQIAKFASTAIFTGLIAFSAIKEYKNHMAKKLVERLEIFKQVNKKYPNQLADLEQYDRYSFVEYQVDSTSQHYTLFYLVDGWHYQKYHSISDRWEGGD